MPPPLQCGLHDAQQVVYVKRVGDHLGTVELQLWLVVAEEVEMDGAEDGRDARGPGIMLELQERTAEVVATAV